MMIRPGTIAAIAIILPLLSHAVGAQNGADREEGQLAFNNNCRTCHVADEGDHRLGPSLHGIVGREAGSSSGARYSSAMRNSDVVWDEEALDRFLENPDAVVPGHNMKPFGGVSSTEERAKIIAYLKTTNEGE